MILGRRDKQGLGQRVRESVWPKSGPRRAGTYIYKRILRLRATPHGIAAGFAAGAFASFTPFIGFHFILGFCVAWLARGSLIAAALGTAIGNPITFPVIWTTTYKLGSWVLGRSTDGIANGGAGRVLSPEAVVDGLVPMVLGGAILGGICAAIVYFPLRMAVHAYQSRRKAKLAAQAAAQAASRQSAIEDDAYQGETPDLAAERTSVGG